jgi:squalene cyclase
LKASLKDAIAIKDPDMLGEFMDTLRSFGLTEDDPLIQTGMEYLLSHQNRDGSWGDKRLRYHATWTAMDGLSEYAWSDEGLSFPELRPLLEKWAGPAP